MTLDEHLDVYVTQRRAMGFELKTGEYLLRQFCRWLTEHGKKDSFTIEDAIQWAIEPPNGAPVWLSQRLTAIRPFAAWLHASGADVPVIPARLLPVRTTRRAPFIYSQADLDHLLHACAFVFANVRVAATMSTLIGLLAATGLRITEALHLSVPDLDTDNDVLFVRGKKTPLDRLVPLHPSTTRALADYLELPERCATNPAPDGPIFVNNIGGTFVSETIEQHFHVLVDALDIGGPSQPHARLHDFRHTFCTRHMIAAYTHDGDPQRTLTLLATWLGHTSVEHTYWYLSAAPQLLAAAAGRLEPDHQPS